jgi:hypothetical protein
MGVEPSAKCLDPLAVALALSPVRVNAAEPGKHNAELLGKRNGLRKASRP